jgi:hypothetical protein
VVGNSFLGPRIIMRISVRPKARGLLRGCLIGVILCALELQPVLVAESASTKSQRPWVSTADVTFYRPRGERRLPRRIALSDLKVMGEWQRRIERAAQNLLRLYDSAWLGFSNWGPETPSRWLWSLAQMQIYSGSEYKLKPLADRIIQLQTPEGPYVSAAKPLGWGYDFPERGQGHATPAMLWYTKATGDQRGIESAKRACEWWGKTYGPDTSVATVATQAIRNEVLLYTETGEPKWLDYAEALASHGGPHFRQEWEQVLGRDFHHGMAVCCTEGVPEVAYLRNRPDLLADALLGWERTRNQRSFVTGGISELTYVHSRTDEMCPTDGWIRLNWSLWAVTRDARFLDEIERSFLNWGFSSQVPTGGFCALRNVDRASMSHEMNYCCSASGTQCLMDVASSILCSDDATLWVNFYWPSEATVSVDIDGKPVRVKVEQKTDFPLSGRAEIDLRPEREAAFRIGLRIPGWVAKFTLKLNGRNEGSGKLEKGILYIERRWKPGDRVEISFPMVARTIRKAEWPLDPECEDFLHLWSVISFRAPKGQGFSAAFPPETKIALSETHPARLDCKDEKSSWQIISSENRRDFQSILFPAKLAGPEELVGYGLTYVKSPSTRPVVLRLGGTAFFKVRLNGEWIFSWNAGRDTVPAMLSWPAYLRQGWNEILVKFGGDADNIAWRPGVFNLGIVDYRGNALSDLRFNPTAPVGEGVPNPKDGINPQYRCVMLGPLVYSAELTANPQLAPNQGLLAAGGVLKKGFYMHPAWLVRPGAVAAEFKLELPQVEGKFSVSAGDLAAPKVEEGPLWFLFDTAVAKGSFPLKFAVVIVEAGGKERSVFARLVSEREWKPAAVNLTPFAGQPITLRLLTEPVQTKNRVAVTLRTEARPPSDTDLDWERGDHMGQETREQGLWGEPRVVKLRDDREELLADLHARAPQARVGIDPHLELFVRTDRMIYDNGAEFSTDYFPSDEHPFWLQGWEVICRDGVPVIKEAVRLDSGFPALRVPVKHRKTGALNELLLTPVAEQGRHRQPARGAYMIWLPTRDVRGLK